MADRRNVVASVVVTAACLLVVLAVLALAAVSRPVP